MAGSCKRQARAQAGDSRSLAGRSPCLVSGQCWLLSRTQGSISESSGPGGGLGRTWTLGSEPERATRPRRPTSGLRTAPTRASRARCQRGRRCHSEHRPITANRSCLLVLLLLLSRAKRQQQGSQRVFSPKPRLFIITTTTAAPALLGKSTQTTAPCLWGAKDRAPLCTPLLKSRHFHEQ
jgi:hypothetical protein